MGRFRPGRLVPAHLNVIGRHAAHKLQLFHSCFRSPAITARPPAVLSYIYVLWQKCRHLLYRAAFVCILVCVCIFTPVNIYICALALGNHLSKNCRCVSVCDWRRPNTDLSAEMDDPVSATLVDLSRNFVLLEDDNKFKRRQAILR